MRRRPSHVVGGGSSPRLRYGGSEVSPADICGGKGGRLGVELRERPREREIEKGKSEGK